MAFVHNTNIFIMAEVSPYCKINPGVNTFKAVFINSKDNLSFVTNYIPLLTSTVVMEYIFIKIDY